MPPSTQKDSWREAILRTVAQRADHPLKLRALARELDIADEDYAAFRALVRELLDEGALSHGPGRTLALPERAGHVVGVYRPHRRGFGFLVARGRPDLFIPRGKARDALDGDQVLARPLPARRRGEPPAAEVMRVLQRAETRWVGVLERIGRQHGVRPQGRAPTPLVILERPDACGARLGDLVVVRPSGAYDGAGAIQGEIVERLGAAQETRVKLFGVTRRHGLPDAFPPEALAEAEAAVAEFERRGPGAAREDLRGLLTVTIDPQDAKDFDDAISVEKLDDGRRRLGVHIADVAHFVTPGGPLDAAARERGLSVYLPGRVTPMLPEALSNGACSLQPGQDRLTRSVFIDYDKHGRPLAARIARSVIRSRARLTYEQASAALSGETPEVVGELSELLHTAERLARTIEKRRAADGMITLDSPEVQIRLNERDEVVDAGPADRSYSHKLIEMFMVAANEAVSRALSEDRSPHPRRVHPEPEPDASKDLGRALAALGKSVPQRLDRTAIQKLLAAVRGRPEESAVNYLVLRSMPQAFYSAESSGHFALASEHYCHFTSPIRRYPDLVVHRALDGLQSPRGPKARRETFALVDEISRECTAAERRALAAEREAKQILLLELMKTKLGETFDGVVTGVVGAGVFVQIPRFLAEGFVPLEDLPDDRWDYEPNLASLAGRRSGRLVRFGTSLKVQIAAVDDVRLELRLTVVGTLSQPEVKRPGRRRRR